MAVLQITKVFPGHLSPNQLKEEFIRTVDSERRLFGEQYPEDYDQNGYRFSGTFASVKELKRVYTDITFDSYDAVFRHIGKVLHRRWDICALAYSDRQGNKFWLVGALVPDPS